MRLLKAISGEKKKKIPLLIKIKKSKKFMRLWKIYFRKKVDQKKEKIRCSVQKEQEVYIIYQVARNCYFTQVLKNVQLGKKKNIGLINARIEKY